MTTSGVRISVVAVSWERKGLPILVMAAKSCTPYWCIHCKTCMPRNGFSPISAKKAVIAARSRPIKFILPLVCMFYLLSTSTDAWTNFHFGKEIGDFRFCGLRAIRSVNRVFVDSAGKIRAYRPRGRLFGIRCAHNLAVFRDRIDALRGGRGDDT